MRIYFFYLSIVALLISTSTQWAMHRMIEGGEGGEHEMGREEKRSIETPSPMPRRRARPQPVPRLDIEAESQVQSSNESDPGSSVVPDPVYADLLSKVPSSLVSPLPFEQIKLFDDLINARSGQLKALIGANPKSISVLIDGLASSDEVKRRFSRETLEDVVKFSQGDASFREVLAGVIHDSDIRRLALQSKELAEALKIIKEEKENNVNIKTKEK